MPHQMWSIRLASLGHVGSVVAVHMLARDAIVLAGHVNLALRAMSPVKVVKRTGKQQNRPSRNHDETNSAGSVGAVYHDACVKRFGLPSNFEDVAEVEFASSSGDAR